jgi:hypothetical protein
VLRYSSTLLLDPGTRRGEGSASRPGRILPPGKDPVPIVQEGGWRVGLDWCEKFRAHGDSVP